MSKKGGRKVVVSTQGSSSVQENIVCVFGAKQKQSLLRLEQKLPSESLIQESGFSGLLEESLFELEGYISSCDHGSGRSTTDRQFYYINSRPCEPPKVIKTVNEVYHQFNQNQYPFVFLNMKTARSEVDVNVTPDKRQIFLENEKALLLIVKASLLYLYESIPSTMKYQNVSLSGASPPVTASISNLSAMLRRWSKSPMEVPQKGVKRVASAGQDDTKSRKVVCLTNFFAKTPKSVSEDSDGEAASKCEIRITDNNSVLASVLTGVTDCNSTVGENKTDNKSEELLVIDSETSLAEVSDRSEILPVNGGRTGSETAKVIGSESEISPDTDSEIVLAVIDSRSEVSLATKIVLEEIDSRNEIIADTGSEAQAAADSEELPVTTSKHEISDTEIALKHEILAADSEMSSVTASNSGKPLVLRVTDSECDTSSEPRPTMVLDVSLDGIRERVSQDRKRQQSEKAAEEVKVKFRAEINPSKNKVAEQELSREITKDMFAKMEILGQFNLGFIITKLGPDLFIIDQHATDEKYNFEVLQRDTVIQNQKLVIPQTLELTAANESILIENEEIFRRNGFTFTVDEAGEATRRVKLQAIPVSRNWHFGKEDIDELLFMLQDSPHTMCRPSRVRAMFASRACRKSVMIGTALGKCDMRRLVDHMGELVQPWNCPHGRPTMRHLVNLDLLRLGDKPHFT